MLRFLGISFIVLSAFICSGLCTEVGFVFDENGDHPIENATISSVKPTDVITFTTASAPDGTGTTYESKKTVAELGKIFDQRVQVENPLVHDQATELAMQSPGEHTIEQICYIHSYLTKKWNYIGDPRGADYYKYANETIELGKKGNLAGAGDCDDFAILMSALVESIGGTTRIMMAKGPQISHAYAEVYLGRISQEDRNVNRIVNWLRNKYNIKTIQTHKDMDTGDVWLNLDWGKDKFKASYPGGAFFQAEKHYPIYIKDTIKKVPLSSSPLALFTHPSDANAGEGVTFDATPSEGIDEISEYDWDFGDNSTGNGVHANHTYGKGDSYHVSLTVTNIQGATSEKTSVIRVNNPPVADFQYSPKNPRVGDMILFNASFSKDVDGKIAAYYWDFNDESFSKMKTCKVEVEEKGNFSVNLTVTDDKGAKRFKSEVIKINEPPRAQFTFSPLNPNPNQDVVFDAATSNDSDGSIRDYNWDLGDGNTTTGRRVTYKYLQGGQFIVKLIVVDNDNASNDASLTLAVNKAPSAIFSCDPSEPSVGEVVTFNASSSKDEDGSISGWKWYYGDGDTAVEESVVQHEYLKERSYTVRLTVSDDNGATNTTSKQVFVKEKATSGKRNTPESSSIIEKPGRQDAGTPSDETYEFPNLLTHPLIGFIEETNATIGILGAIRTPLEDANATQENLILKIGLKGTDRATYHLKDADGNVYEPFRYMTLSSGNQLAYFLIPKDDLFKLIEVTTAGGELIVINWWGTPKGSNDNLIVRYYGVTDWQINNDEQEVVVQVRVQNSGTQNLIVGSEDFTLLDQSGSSYHPTSGFNEIVEPQKATDRVLLGFTGIPLTSQLAALAYSYNSANQITIDFDKDYVPLSDELVYGANYTKHHPSIPASRLHSSDELVYGANYTKSVAAVEPAPVAALQALTNETTGAKISSEVSGNIFVYNISLTNETTGAKISSIKDSIAARKARLASAKRSISDNQTYNLTNPQPTGSVAGDTPVTIYAFHYLLDGSEEPF